MIVEYYDRVYGDGWWLYSFKFLNTLLGNGSIVTRWYVTNAQPEFRERQLISGPPSYRCSSRGTCRWLEDYEPQINGISENDHVCIKLGG
jgi:hypothetical protein